VLRANIDRARVANIAAIGMPVSSGFTVYVSLRFKLQSAGSHKLRYETPRRPTARDRDIAA
jgi:hypothetical protein